MGKGKKKARTKIKGNSIKSRIEKLSMSQHELALACGTNDAHISRVITGKAALISLDLAGRIARVLKQPIERVFDL